MAEFQPDIDGLLQRFTIEKPSEQFQVAPVAPDPESAPPPVGKSNFSVPQPSTTSPPPLGKTEFSVPQPSQVQRLQDEAAKVQEIIDILKDTASQVSVPVPPEEQPFLGAMITTADYIASLENSDDLSHRKQQTFESGVLNQYGDNPHWPILMAKDLIDTRNSLLSARDISQGKLLNAPLLGTVAAGSSDSWKASFLRSDLTAVTDQMIQGSEKLRFKTAQTVFTLNTSLGGSVIGNLLSDAVDPQPENIKPNIKLLLRFLGQVRALLTHSQLLLGFEHVRSGQELQTSLESNVIEQILNILIVKLSDTVTHFATPVLDALQNGLGSGPIVNKLGTHLDNQLVSIIGGTCKAIATEYKQQVAGLVRGQQKKNNLQSDKLQSLGERSLVGRWIVHLDQIIATLQKVVDTPSLTRAAATQAIAAALKPPAPPSHPILQRFLEHPELQQAQTLALQARTFGVTNPQAEPPGVPLGSVGPQLPDPRPQFGSSDINAYPKI